MVGWAAAFPALKHSIPNRKDQIVRFHHLKVGKKGNVMKDGEISLVCVGQSACLFSTT